MFKFFDEEGHNDQDVTKEELREMIVVKLIEETRGILGISPHKQL